MAVEWSPRRWRGGWWKETAAPGSLLQNNGGTWGLGPSPVASGRRHAGQEEPGDWHCPAQPCAPRSLQGTPVYLHVPPRGQSAASLQPSSALHHDAVIMHSCSGWASLHAVTSHPGAAASTVWPGLPEWSQRAQGSPVVMVLHGRNSAPRVGLGPRPPYPGWTLCKTSPRGRFPPVGIQVWSSLRRRGMSSASFAHLWRRWVHFHLIFYNRSSWELIIQGGRKKERENLISFLWNVLLTHIALLWNKLTKVFYFFYTFQSPSMCSLHYMFHWVSHINEILVSFWEKVYLVNRNKFPQGMKEHICKQTTKSYWPWWRWTLGFMIYDSGQEKVSQP